MRKKKAMIALSLLLAFLALCLTDFPAMAAESATAATMQLMKTEGTEELAKDPGLCGEILEASGLDVLGALETAQERLEREMREILDRVGDQQTEQDRNVSTGTVWEQNGPASSAPDSSTAPDNNTGGSNSSGSGGGATDDPAPPAQRTITLEMNVTAEIVQEYLNTDGVEEVILLASGNSDENILTVDIPGMFIPAGKTLTLSGEIDIEIWGNSSLIVEGTVNGTGALTNNGLFMNDESTVQLPTMAGMSKSPAGRSTAGMIRLS